ncbi:hypothetical protein [Phenylobacterium sp.]|uniref:hypothetical protein n=1 Tax=Phenylobacterium sp. TaxID=1871053 RepID=UPI002F3EEB59
MITAKALGSIQTDDAGHAQTPPIASGRYYLVGVYPYQGRALLWDVPVTVQVGSNTVTLSQLNSRPIH